MVYSKYRLHLFYTTMEYGKHDRLYNFSFDTEAYIITSADFTDPLYPITCTTSKLSSSTVIFAS